MTVEVKNVPAGVKDGYIVCTPSNGDLWYYTHWETKEEALKALRMDLATYGIERVVVKVG